LPITAEEGGGSVIGNASEMLRSFTRHTNFPITQTLMGLGAYPATDSQSLGMLGMHGTYEANMAMHDSDCIIAVGARFDDRITGNLDKFCPYAKIIHIDIDPSSVGKTVGVDVAIIGQVNDALNALIQALKDQKLVRCPHLVLTHITSNNRLALSNFIQSFNHTLWFNDTRLRLIRH
jgi:acetolactate synthase-1/2/3 large subunit